MRFKNEPSFLIFSPFFFYSYLLLEWSTRHFDYKNNWICSWSLFFLFLSFLSSSLGHTAYNIVFIYLPSPFFPFLLIFFFLGNKRDFHKVRREWSARYNWFRINKYKNIYQHFLYFLFQVDLTSFLLHKLNWRLWKEPSIVVWQWERERLF